MKCSYTFETAVLLNLHIQNHTGEMLIDESYAEKVKSPERKSETTIKGTVNPGGNLPLKYCISGV